VRILIAIALLAGCAAPPPEPELVPLPTDHDLPLAAPVQLPQPVAPPARPPEPLGGNQVWVTLGPGYWQEIADLDTSASLLPPNEFGEFEEWGFGIGFGDQGRIAQRDWQSLWLGGELGFAGFENEEEFLILFSSGEIEEGSFSADLFWLTPTVTWRAELAPQDAAAGYVRLGGGYYDLSLTEAFWGYADEVDSDDGLGWFFAVGFEIRLGDSPVFLRIEDQVHYFDLEPFPDVLPGEDAVDGPLHCFQIGVTIRI
jgi:hypothetical protein